MYWHFRLNGVYPEIGDFVRRGEILGYTGSTGFSTGAHLHFQVGQGADNELALFETASSTCYEPNPVVGLHADNQVCNPAHFCYSSCP